MFAIEKDEAKRRIAALAEHFSRDSADFRSATYNETQTRHQFIDPLFEALGWDVQNRNRYAEAYKDVIHEDAIKVQGGTKAPDYCFRIGGRRIFFVEAKKPAMNIQMDASLAYQLRRYGWSSRLNVSILTDFEEFAVYDCRIKPLAGDSVAAARIRYLRYDTYLDNFDELWDLFARDSVLKGSLDRFAEDTRAKRGTAPVDQEFLKEIERWRDLLARTIALRNPALDVRGLNIAVQRTIDRIIFLRICEDRGIEEYGALMGLCNGHGVYERLKQRFDLAEQRYNSGLFHFEREKGIEEAPDTLTPSLVIDDKPLADILKKLYYPDSPYEFSMIGADILGQVYEQFLGKVIRLTAGHQAKVEEKPEVRKAGGVYYTPTYIVDYIVKNTVGTLCADKRPAEVKKLKILDPACGSGSFLLGAYQYLIDYCRDWYVQDGPEKHGKRVYQAAGGQWLLTTAEKRELLTSCIHGVDIDAQAVEVTKLNLLLKCLEGESGESIAQHNLFYKERALPNLGANIKCGNSLIGSDYFDDYQDALFDDETVRRVNPFDWDGPHGFPAIMRAGGFDAVIGNPPYILLQNDFKDEVFVKYAKSKFEVASYKIDTYHLFFEIALRLLREYGRASYITPSNYMSNKYLLNLRKLLINNYSIESILTISGGVFSGASVDTSITVIFNSKPSDNTTKLLFSTNDPDSIKNPHIVTISQTEFSKNKFFLVRSGLPAENILMNKMDNNSVELCRLLDVNFGMQLRNRKIYVDDVIRIENGESMPDRYRMCITGKDVNRYSLIWGKLACLESTEARRGGCWDLDKHHSNDKIITRQIGMYPTYALDRFGYNCLNTVFMITQKTSHISMLYILGILNSKLLRFYWIKKYYDGRNTFPKIKGEYLKMLPVIIDPISALNSDIEIASSKLIALYGEVEDAEITVVARTLQSQIFALERHMNQLVYKLYGLTEEEIRIVEESLNEHA